MSRLTDKDWKNPESLMWTKLGLIPMRNERYRTSLSEALRKLAHYEDLEDEGRLKELPFVVGDTVYTNQSMPGWYMQKKKRPYEAKIVFIGINGIDDIFNIELGEGKMLGFRFSDIGKTVFLNREAAEAKLKEMEGAQ